MKLYKPFLLFAVFFALATNAFATQTAVLKTSYGIIEVEFFDKVAPNHVKNFISLAKSGFYNGTYFHRVIPGFMIQGGDPNTKDNDRSNDGMGNADKTINAEFSSISHKRGILSMARSQNPNSASSQFFIMQADYPSLDGKYSVFGKVIKGMDVVDKIVSAPRDRRDNPNKHIYLESVTVKGK